MKMISVIILVTFLGLVILSPIIVPEEYIENRDKGLYLLESPKRVPPRWVNLFTFKDKAVQETLEPVDVKESYEGVKKISYTFEYDYKYDIPPQDLVLELWAEIDRDYPVVVIQIVTENEKIEICKDRFKSTSLQGKYSTGKYSFAILGKRRLYSRTDRSITYEFFDPMREIFKGKRVYSVAVDVYILDNTKIKKQVLTVVGSVYGVLGTDSSGRDIFFELLYSSKNTVIIVFLASIFGVVFGVIYGTTSGYIGGRLDAVMQWLASLFMIFPALPTVVLLIWYFSTSIRGFIVDISLLEFSLILSLFVWPIYEKTARSICLQLKVSEYVTVAKGLGANSKRIILKHILPQLYPFTLASISINIPKTLVFISLLGFFNLVPGLNWGSFLAEAYKEGAILKGMWWWVVSPGALIAILAIAFVNLGKEIEEGYDIKK